jgi:hypothetical protein
VMITGLNGPMSALRLRVANDGAIARDGEPVRLETSSSYETDGGVWVASDGLHMFGLMYEPETAEVVRIDENLDAARVQGLARVANRIVGVTLLDGDLVALVGGPRGATSALRVQGTQATGIELSMLVAPMRMLSPVRSLERDHVRVAPVYGGAPLSIEARDAGGFALAGNHARAALIIATGDRREMRYDLRFVACAR